MFKRYNYAINTLLQPFVPRRVRTEEHVSSRTHANALQHTLVIFVRQVMYTLKRFIKHTLTSFMHYNCQIKEI